MARWTWRMAFATATAVSAIMGEPCNSASGACDADVVLESESAALRMSLLQTRPKRSSADGTRVLADKVDRCKITEDYACPMASMSQGGNAYTVVYPGGDTRCLDEMSPFGFQVWPGNLAKLVVHFGPGGACFDKRTTVQDVGVMSKGLCWQSVVEQGSDGVFNKEDDRNPWKDYTILNINQCTGDAGVGNISHAYEANAPSEQRGYANALAALGWVKRQVNRNLESLIISGASAGALGAQFWSNTLLTDFKSEGRSYQKSAVIVDSYVGLFPGSATGKLIQRFGICRTALMSPTLDSECGRGKPRDSKQGPLTVAAVMKETMTAHPDTAFAIINSKMDRVQVFYYKTVAMSFMDFFGSMLTPSQYYRKVNALLREYSSFPNFVSYLIDGGAHTFMGMQEQKIAKIVTDFRVATEHIPPPPVPRELNDYYVVGTGTMPSPVENLLLHRWMSLFARSRNATPEGAVALLRPKSQCRGPRLNAAEASNAVDNYCDATVASKVLRLER